MTEQDRRIESLRAVLDQAWAAWRPHLLDIKRIAAVGPRLDGSDDALVMGVFSLVGGEMHFRMDDLERD